MAHVKVWGAKEDGVVECFLYPKICYTEPAEKITEEVLLKEITKFNEAIAQYIEGYIWQHESLRFYPKTTQMLLKEKLMESSSSLKEYDILPYIYINLCFDEDISDEWFTVFLMFQLTRIFDGLIAKIVDSDGEFLLIEAANVLPSWVNPDVCEGHVFVYNGELHILRRNKHETLLGLLNNIQKQPHTSKASDKVQDVLRKRIDIYPDEIKKKHHKARVFLPEKAASLLQQEPGLIALAIRTICHSDLLERKVCRAMRYFPPEQRVMVNIKMTKCLYAMANHCSYTGDLRTGWNIPPATCSSYKSHILGIKIACGLEMLVARAISERQKRQTKASSDLGQLNINENALNAYLKRLQSSGYFRNLLEGSEEHQRLQNDARDYYVKYLNSQSSIISGDKSDAERVLEAWENVQSNDVELYAQDESSLSPADSDSWLNVDPEQFEAYLHEKWGISSTAEDGPVMLTLKERIQLFLEQKSDIRGVRHTRDHSADSEMICDTKDCGKVEFDADIFDNTLKGILDLVVPGNEGEFEGSSEGSLDGDDEEGRNEMDKYMRLLNSELQNEIERDETSEMNKHSDLVEGNLMRSIVEEAGGTGPVGNIVGEPARRLMHLQLQSPTTVPPDLQS